MEQDFENRGDLANIRWDGPYESLCDDPRFKDLLQRTNLPSHSINDVTIPYVFRSSVALLLSTHLVMLVRDRPLLVNFA
jgi:hypothetical protein